MKPRTRRLGGALTAVALAVLANSASAQCSNYALSPAGTNLALGDDAARTVALPFAFPFHGVNYTAISVSSNGFVWLGADASSGFSSSESAFLALGPRIAVIWDDLDPSPAGSGAVYYAANASQASVCWQGVQHYGSSQTGTLANCECILTASGSIYLNYDASCTFNLSTSSSIVGISAGGSVVAAGTHLQDWSTAVPSPGAALAVTNATAYQLFNFNSRFDLLGGFTLCFAPTGVDTYDVHRCTLPTCAPAVHPALTAAPVSIGSGCPSPDGAIYEAFTLNSGANPVDLANTSIEWVRAGNTYTATAGPGWDPGYYLGTPLIMGDDTLQTVSVGAMGSFTFGTVAMTTLSVSSNGFVWMPTGPNSDFTPTGAELATLQRRVAPYWTDLDPVVWGGVFFENTNPAFTQVTWENVPEHGVPITWNYVQLTLRSNGNIVFSYGPLSGGTVHPVVVGLSGGLAIDDGSVDLVTSGVVNFRSKPLTGGPPMIHTSSPLAIGLPFQMSSIVPDPVSGAGFFVIGTSNPNIPLDAIGMTGCTQYASLDNVYFLLFAASPMTISLNTPFDPAFLGVNLFSQAAAFSTLNPFGVIASNGLSHVIGI
jgi:hypothetical protein